MMQTVTETLVDELKSRPFTLLTLLALIASAWYAHSEHAWAKDVDGVAKHVSKIESKLDKLLVINITTAIQERRREFCSTNDEGLRRLLSESINELRESYREITGEVYILESCESSRRRSNGG